MLLLISILLISTAFSTAAEIGASDDISEFSVIKTLMSRHDHVSCAAVAAKGVCGLMNQMNAVWSTDCEPGRCTETCKDVPVVTRNCAYFYPLANCPDAFKIPVSLPFDNTEKCGRMPSGMWINIMINVACPSKEMCLAASLGGLNTGCVDMGFEDSNGQNGDGEAGMTNGFGVCHAHINGSIKKSPCDDVNTVSQGIINSYDTTLATLQQNLHNAQTADPVDAAAVQLTIFQMGVLSMQKEQADSILPDPVPAAGDRRKL